MHKEIAAGRAPCRHCLRLIQEHKEELLLFTYDPFREVGAPPLPGPVYLQAEECPRHSEDQKFPEAYEGRKLTFDAYREDGELIKGTLVTSDRQGEIANRFFENPEFGIFMCEVRKPVVFYSVWSGLEINGKTGSAVPCPLH